MPTGSAAEDAIQGLTDWDGLAHFAEAFGGGWQAVAALGIVAICLTAMVVSVAIVFLFWRLSAHRTQEAIERLRTRAKSGRTP